MAYCLTEIVTAQYPDAETLRAALLTASLSEDDIVSAIKHFTCPDELDPHRGYQMAIARNLEDHLRARLVAPPTRRLGNNRYSPQLNEKADVSIAATNGRQLYIEIEFRPNVEKDLIKFQIGANSGSLLAAVLIVAVDRTAVNAGYTTMPEFRKVSSIIDQLRPAYPLLLIGIRGKHIAVERPAV